MSRIGPIRQPTPRGQSLEVVERASRSWAFKKEFEDVEAWMVAFKADQPYPAKFVYRACTKCMKTLEKGDVCGHGTSLNNAHIVFRFKVQLCDHTGPLWCSIFDAAQIFLGYEAAEFASLDPEDQRKIATEKFNRGSYCNFRLQAYRGDVIVRCLQVLKFRNDSGPMSSSTGETARTKKLSLDEEEYEALMSAVRKINFGEGSSAPSTS